MEKTKEKFEEWEEYVKFASECDKDPHFRKVLNRFIKITS